MPGSAKGPLELIVSADRLTAAVRLTPPADPGSVQQEQVLELLAAQKIPVTNEVQERVAAFLASCAQGVMPAEPVPLAVGSPAANGEDAALCWSEGYDPASRRGEREDGSVDFYSRQSYVVAKADDLLLTIRPPGAGQDGRDVHGNPIKARSGAALNIGAGANVTRSEDGLRFTSTQSGRILFDGRTLAISPVLEIRGDVDFESGNVDFNGDVLIGGGVLDRFQVRSGGDVEIGGPVEGAILRAGGDVLLRAGAMMKAKGYLHVQGNLTAKLLSNAFVLCRGNVHVGRELLNCTVLCFGSLAIERGILAGGLVIARGGIRVETLGSATARTIVVAGHDPALAAELDRLAADAQKHTDGAARIREALRPLLAGGGRLSPAQRKKCNALLAHAAASEQQARDCQERRAALERQVQAACVEEIHVARLLYGDTIVRLGDECGKVPEDLRGPVKLVVRRGKRASVIAGVWPDGTEKPLDCPLTVAERKAALDLPVDVPQEPQADGETVPPAQRPAPE
jgi:uncharacterized protein (DUF342 family)